MAARSRTARPRVVCRSSPSAWKLGHMAPWWARQAALPLQASAARASPPSAGERDGGGDDSGDAGPAMIRRPASSASGRTSTPGLSRPCGSRASLSAAKAAIVAGGYIRGSNSLRTRPSPCSPGQRPAVGDDQVGDALGDAPHPRDRTGQAQVQQRPDVQAPDAGVAVPDRRQALLGEQAPHLAGERGRPRRRHGRVFDERQRRGVGCRRAVPTTPSPRSARAIPARRTAQTAGWPAGSSTACAPADAGHAGRGPRPRSPLYSMTSSAPAPRPKPVRPGGEPARGWRVEHRGVQQLDRRRPGGQQVDHGVRARASTSGNASRPRPRAAGIVGEAQLGRGDDRAGVPSEPHTSAGPIRVGAPSSASRL